MVSCKHCQTPNSLDSTFCKRCGAAISESELVEARAKMEKLTEEGNALFNQGRTDEALAIAEAAVLSNPSSTSAWSLKTLCHERRGEIAEALECADRLVELNPDSDFDKIRRATLRQKLQTDLAVPRSPDRRLATVGAVSAVVLVLCIGAIVARINSNSATASRSTASEPTLIGGGVTPGSNVNSTPANPVQTNPNAGVASQPNPNLTQVQPNPQVTQPNAADTQVGRPQPRGNEFRQELPSNSGERLPTPYGTDTEIVPLQPDVTNLRPSGGNNAKSEPVLPKKNMSGSGLDPDDPTAIGSGNGGAPIAVPQTPRSEKPEDNGIFITVHKSGNGGPAAGGAEPASGTNGLEALLRVGNQQYQLGNFGGAVKSYEQALQAGGDSIVLNRRLALAYEKLGRRSDAADSYRKCISAIDAALAAGRGNRDSLTSTKEVCDQALKVLQGG